MSALVNKRWWYKPNAYTTVFAIKAVFADGTSEYKYTRETAESEWVLSESDDQRIVIETPSAGNGERFIVRAYTDDLFISLSASYANETANNDAVPVALTRFVFDKTFFSTHQFEPNCNFDNPYDLFNDDDLGDIYFTNLTKKITLPDKKYNYVAWYGWGVYNETKPYSEMILNPDGKYIMPVSWIYSWKLAGYPTIGIADSTSSHPGIISPVEAPIVDNKLYLVPLYHYENKQFTIDTHDYVEPEPTPAPTPEGKPNFYVWPTFTIAGQTIPWYEFDSEEYPAINATSYIQWFGEDNTSLPDIASVELGNKKYDVVFVNSEEEISELDTTKCYFRNTQVFPIEALIAEAEDAGLDLNLTADNGNWASGFFISMTHEEIHGDITLTLYDSNGNSSSVTVIEYTEDSDEPDEPSEPDYLCFTANNSGARLCIIGNYSDTAPVFDIEYSLDGDTWNDYEFTNTDGSAKGLVLTFENVGDKVYFRGTNANFNDYDGTNQPTYTYKFSGDPDVASTNSFAVSGDIQTLIAKDGNNKTAGNFMMAFQGDPGGMSDRSLIITNAPDLTATTLSPICYYGLCMAQRSLDHPADCTGVTINSSNVMDFVSMYSMCTSTIMTADNGETLEGFSSISYPITVSSFLLEEPITLYNNFDFAYYILENTKGFQTLNVYIPKSIEHATITTDNISNESSGSYNIHRIWVPTNSTGSITMTVQVTDNTYTFVKWQVSTDGETWTDIPDATNTQYTATFSTTVPNYYYRPVCEQL